MWLRKMYIRLGSVFGGSMTLASREASADWELNMRQGVTDVSHQVYDLHMYILWICVIIGILVFGAMFWSIWRHRKSKGVQAAQFHHSTTAEVAWTIIPVFILVGMAIPATHTLIAMEDTSSPDMTVKVTGYQWKWKYDYLDDKVSFFSNLRSSSRAAVYADPSQVENYLLEVDNPLVVPVNKKIRFLITSGDVIHSWWIPDLGWKKDAIPGFINEMWTRISEPGTYRGQCAELCGKDHGFMPVVVVAKSDEDYRQWVAKQQVAQRAGESTETPQSLPASSLTTKITSDTAAAQL
jgi:cytochrome c oxidase subunit 2